MQPDEVKLAVRDGRFKLALHIAALYLRGSMNPKEPRLSFGAFDVVDD